MSLLIRSGNIIIWHRSKRPGALKSSREVKNVPLLGPRISHWAPFSPYFFYPREFSRGSRSSGVCINYQSFWMASQALTTRHRIHLSHRIHFPHRIHLSHKFHLSDRIHLSHRILLSLRINLSHRIHIHRIHISHKIHRNPAVQDQVDLTRFQIIRPIFPQDPSFPQNQTFPQVLSLLQDPFVPQDQSFPLHLCTRAWRWPDNWPTRQVWAARLIIAPD